MPLALFGTKEQVINISLFFGLIFAVLMMIYIFFKPMEFKKYKLQETPLIEIQDFTLYELDKRGITSLFGGSNSKRYEDRDIVENIDYTDSSADLKANISAKKGIHMGETIELHENVIYSREDGVRFESESAHYDKKSAIFFTDKNFIIYKGKNSTTGNFLLYKSKEKITNAKKIQAVYQLQESNK